MKREMNILINILMNLAGKKKGIEEKMLGT